MPFNRRRRRRLDSSELQRTILRGETSAVRKLLATPRGIDLDHADSRGWTALHCAAAMDDRESAELLLKAGANPNLSTANGRTPLHIAIQFGATALFYWLRARPEVQDLADAAGLRAGDRLGDWDAPRQGVEPSQPGDGISSRDGIPCREEPAGISPTPPAAEAHPPSPPAPEPTRVETAPAEPAAAESPWPSLVGRPASWIEARQHATAAIHGVERCFRDRLRSGGEGPELMVIPAGLLPAAGSEVRIAPFAIGRYPVTFEEYDRFCAAAGRRLPNAKNWGRGRQPVIDISRWDAMGYLRWLGAESGFGYRLPTEQEWEYAARAGSVTRFWWGDAVGRGNANCEGCGENWDNPRPSPVGAFNPNPFGLYDTAGNVWEWTESLFHDFAGNGDPDDPRNRNAKRVVKGGGWLTGERGLGAAERDGRDPASTHFDLGFRVVRVLC